LIEPIVPRSIPAILRTLPLSMSTPKIVEAPPGRCARVW